MPAGSLLTASALFFHKIQATALRRRGEGIPKQRNLTCSEGLLLEGRFPKACRREGACGEKFKK